MSIEADISSPAAQAQLAALAANLAGQEEKKVRMYAHTNYPSTQLLSNLRLLAPPLLSPSLTHAHIRFHVSGASHPSNSL